MRSPLQSIRFRPIGARSVCCDRAAVVILMLLLAASTVAACNIPVFRYALERWKPDPCEILVFHNQDFDESQQAVVDQIRRRTIGPDQGSQNGHANAKLSVVDLRDNADSKQREIWDDLRQNTEASLPQVLVRTRLGRGQFINHWHGSLASLTDQKVLQSPARDEIRDRLLSGHSVVWLLIRSSDQTKNANAKRLAENTFRTLQSKIQLPEGIGLPGSELYADVPLILKFSLLEIDPDDKNELFLAGLLTGLRKQPFDEGEPLFVPVFGRGRALEVIPANDMSARLMEDLTAYLSGACSCQVKEQNPGFDLLIEADWDTQLFGHDGAQPPDRSAEEGRQRNPTLVPIPPGR